MHDGDIRTAKNAKVTKDADRVDMQSSKLLQCLRGNKHEKNTNIIIKQQSQKRTFSLKAVKLSLFAPTLLKGR